MGYGQTGGYFFDNSLMIVLLLAVKLLWIVFVVGIIAGLVVEAKRRGWDKLWLSFDQQISGHNHHERHFCAVCGHKISSKWQYCPSCSSPTKSESKIQKIEVSENKKNEELIDEIVISSASELATSSDDATQLQSESIQQDDELIKSDMTTENVRSQGVVGQVAVIKEGNRGYNNNKQKQSNNKQSNQKSRRRKSSDNGKSKSNL